METPEKRISKLFKFFIVSSVGLSADFIIFSILSRLSNLIFLSNIISTSVALLLSYLLNGKFVFLSKPSFRKAIVYFLFISLSNVAFSEVVEITTKMTGFNEVIIKGIFLPFSFTVNYVLARQALALRSPAMPQKNTNNKNRN